MLREWRGRALDGARRPETTGLIACLLAAGFSLPAFAQSSEEVILLDPVVIQGSGEGDAANGPLPDYVATATRGATKTDTPLIETPQSVSVIGQKQLEATGARTLGEATRYSAGVRELFGGADPRYDQYQIRGFNASTTGIYLDGMQLLSSSGLAFRIEPYGLDRIDILRGPSSVLYGGTNPGGLVNAVSKRPTDVPFAEVTTGINSFGNVYGGFDVGGPLGSDDQSDPGLGGVWSYRLTGLGKLGETQTDFSEDNRAFIAPSLNWNSRDGTSFTVYASYQRDKTTGVPFLPYVGTVVDAPFGRIPTDFVTSKPDEGGSYNGVEREQAMLGYEFEHTVSDALTVRSRARYSRGENELFSLIGGGYVGGNPASGRLTRLAFFANPVVDLFTTDNQLEARFATGPVDHTALVGIDYKNVRFDDTQRTGGASPIDIFSPDYDQPFSGLSNLGIRAESRQDQFGVYVQDQMKFERLSLVGGARFDSVDTEIDNRLNSRFSGSDTETAFSGKVGVVYDLGFGLAPYASYSNSFQPLVGINNATLEILKPEEGEQYEVGVKFQPEGWRSFATLSAFDLTRRNFLVSNPANALQTIQSGEARARGFEFEAVASLDEGLDFIVSYTDFDIENTENLNSALIGLAPQNTPERFASAFLDYTVPSGTLAGLGGGFGVRYMGEAWADAANTFRLPSYTLADAVLHYETGSWRGAVNVSNLFDKTYVAQCSNLNQCFYGERRKVTASLTKTW